jgi:hypothetical protein
MYNVGKVKYLVSHHDGIEKHNDGSDFFGIKCFTNKRKMVDFLVELEKRGYVDENEIGIERKVITVPLLRFDDLKS